MKGARMRGRLMRGLFAAAMAAGLSACGGPPDLITLTSDSQGPDEFAIVPNKPLQAPESFNALPPPTPGGTNRSDQTPEADAIAALGGRPQAGQVQGGALIARATRFGVNGDIRRTLASEDLAFREDNDGRLLERLFNTSIYYKAYAPQSLDQHAELERFRRQGVRTPAAPPEELQ